MEHHQQYEDMDIFAEIDLDLGNKRAKLNQKHSAIFLIFSLGTIGFKSKKNMLTILLNANIVFLKVHTGRLKTCLSKSVSSVLKCHISNELGGSRPGLLRSHTVPIFAFKNLCP